MATADLTLPGVVITARRMQGNVFTISERENAKAARFRSHFPGWQCEVVRTDLQMSRARFRLVAFPPDKQSWLEWRNG